MKLPIVAARLALLVFAASAVTGIVESAAA
jgi:hypothetical protein